MKTWLFIAIAGVVLVTGACAPTFMVGKRDKMGVYLGSKSKAAYDAMCSSGELEKVLASTQFSKEMKDTFYRYNCSEEASAQSLKKLFASMTRAERKDIKNAFKKNGYSINGGEC